MAGGMSPRASLRVGAMAGSGAGIGSSMTPPRTRRSGELSTGSRLGGGLSRQPPSVWWGKGWLTGSPGGPPLTRAMLQMRNILWMMSSSMSADTNSTWMGP